MIYCSYSCNQLVLITSNHHFEKISQQVVFNLTFRGYRFGFVALLQREKKQKQNGNNETNLKPSTKIKLALFLTRHGQKYDDSSEVMTVSIYQELRQTRESSWFPSESTFLHEPLA